MQKEIDAFLMTELNLVRQLSRSLILANAVNATLTMVSRTFSGPLLSRQMQYSPFRLHAAGLALSTLT